MKKYATGLVIGRFQPFHLGHAYLLSQALSYCEKIAIGIGSSNIHNSDNPYSYKIRKAMLIDFVRAENMEESIIQIFPLVDYPEDDIWFDHVQKKISNFDVVIGNNDWVNGIFKRKGYEVLEINMYKRHLLEGKQIRERISLGKGIEKRVPKYVKDRIS